MQSAVQRLYYTDCYLSSFDSRILGRSNDGRKIYLERTAFYPTSGGQPHNLGFLGDQPLVDVVDEGQQIAHITAGPVEGEVVSCAIDWPRRYDHMQQHTGQHLLSAVFVELFGFQTLSFHLGGELSTIELGTKELTDLQIDLAEERVNALTREARAVRISFEEAEAVRALRKPSERTGSLRIIEIDGVDRSACGGTHARSTAEAGPVQIRKLEKIRGNVRIEFVCGIRALRRAKQDFRIALELSRQTAVGIDAVPDYVASLRQRLTAAEKDRQKLAAELARAETQVLYESTPPGADGIRRLSLNVPTIDDAVRSRMQSFTKNGKAIVLVIGAEPPGVIIAASGDSGINAGAVLKEALSKVGARGGGSATLAQGSLPDRAVADEIAARLGFAGG